MRPALIVFSGLPGSGKSTLARLLAEDTGATQIRIDEIEQALRDANPPGTDIGAEGYLQGYKLAGQALSEGRPVIADAVNAVELAREGWRQVARAHAVPIIEIAITCSKPDEHRHRLESRQTDIPGLRDVSWEQASLRAFEPNPYLDIQLDTSGQTPPQSLAALKQKLALQA